MVVRHSFIRAKKTRASRPYKLVLVVVQCNPQAAKCRPWGAKYAAIGCRRIAK